jgi:hypothetical protein
MGQGVMFVKALDLIFVDATGLGFYSHRPQ